MKKPDTMRLPRSFAWLNVTQFLGALNDNVFKLLLIFQLKDVLGADKRALIVATASIVFVVPFLLFSHAAGVLADRFSKRTIVVGAKFLELAVMAVGCAAISVGNPIFLYAVLFLMCTQSALFGPSKYGIIPELVPSDRLSKANSLLVGLTYLAIIIGTFLPSFLLLEVLQKSYLGLGLVCVGIAGVGVAASLRIARTEPAGSKRRFSPLFLLEIYRTLRSVRADAYLFLALMGSAYFLFLGAFIQQNALLFGQDYLGMGWIQSGYLFPLAALGIGIGAVLSGRLSGRNIEFGIVPVGAFGLTVCCILLGVLPPSFRTAGVLVFLVGVSSGLYIVPLNAFMQYRSPPGRRGEILACSSFMSFLGAALSAGFLLLLDKVLGVNAPGRFVVIGVMTGVLAAAAIAVLPDFLVRFVVVALTRFFYRIDVSGLEYLPVEGGALLVPNHVTWVDAVLLSAVQQRRIRFVMAKEIYERRWIRPLFRLMGVIPISRKDAPRSVVASLKQARAALDDGYLVCIFAEGGITRNGNMHGFKNGFSRIVKGSDYPILPVHIGGGAWGSTFSYFHGRLVSSLPSRIPYPVSIRIGRPMPPTASTEDVREAVSVLGGESFDRKKAKTRTLAHLFVRSARKHWGRPAMTDTTGKRITFGRALTGAVLLGDLLREPTRGQGRVGVALPATVGGALTNVALTLLGKVPVNLNFTSSAEAVDAAVSRADLKTVVTSRSFMERLERFSPQAELIYLEDLLPCASGGRKIWALLRALCAPVSRLQRHCAPLPDDPATIIFSSGSTGIPKGVVLTQHNVISNIEAFLMVVRFSRDDRMCGILPFFHSFGFTCTLWCPLLHGFSVHFHPNPLDPEKVLSLVRDEKLTILLATPTFLLSYIRRGRREDFQSLRMVIVGAEKLKARIADAFETKFGLRPLEGYGTTELSPVAAVALPDVTVDRVTQVGTKEGSIGHPIPGVTFRIVDVDTGEKKAFGETGLVLVKGPNVMAGYLHDPDRTKESMHDGWYVTGDVGRMDEDGFVFLSDRLSRFSKIGGEMVPHMAVEDALAAGLDMVDRGVVVTAVADDRKGEQLVVLHTTEAGDAESLCSILAESDLPNLWKPRKQNYVKVAVIPVLGSGKLDLKRCKEIAAGFASQKRGVVEKTIQRVRESL